MDSRSQVMLVKSVVRFACCSMLCLEGDVKRMSQVVARLQVSPMLSYCDPGTSRLLAAFGLCEKKINLMTQSLYVVLLTLVSIGTL